MGLRPGGVSLIVTREVSTSSIRGAGGSNLISLDRIEYDLLLHWSTFRSAFSSVLRVLTTIPVRFPTFRSIQTSVGVGPFAEPLGGSNEHLRRRRAQRPEVETWINRLEAGESNE